MDVMSCSDISGGSARVSVEGETDGFNFLWYVGSVVRETEPDFRGIEVRNLSAGAYAVVSETTDDGMQECAFTD